MTTRKKDTTTEQKIMDAAIAVFHRRGVHGARMQEIADEAGIAKSMLHYYFDTKENLFEKVFTHTVTQIFPLVNGILASELPLFEKIERFVDRYTELLIEHHYSAAFVMAELSYNTETAIDLMVTNSGWNPVVIKNQLEAEARAGRILTIDPRNFMLNLFALTVYPFIGLPMHLKRFKMSQAEYFQFVRERKEFVTQSVIRTIKT